MINKKLQKPTYSEIINYPFLPAHNAIEKLDHSKIQAPTYVSLTGDSSGETTAPGIAYGAFGSLNGDLPAVKLPPSKDEIDALIQGHKLPSWRDALQRETTGNDSQTAVETPEGAGDTIVETEPQPQPMTFEEYILSLKSKADDAYKQSVANAELERQRASVDAQNTYDRGRSAYGSNAEALSAMGLTGSGYGQYLDSKAYAQMRGDMNAANALKSAAVTDAQARRENSYAQADASYMDYLNTQATNKQNAYISMLGTITADTPLSEIENFAGAYGLSPEQIEALKTTREDRIKTYLDTNDYDVDTLKRLLGEDHASYSDYLTKLQGTVGSIDSSWFRDEETGELVSKQKAQEVLNGLKSYGLTEEQMQKAQEVLDATYAISSGGSVTFNRDGLLDNTHDVTTGTEGNNISVKDGDGKKYRVQYSGENDESGAVKKAAEARGLKEGDVFMYKDKVYVIQDGKCYGIEKRDNAYAGHWSALLDKLKGNESTTEE
jgi:hypothetical protein